MSKADSEAKYVLEAINRTGVFNAWDHFRLSVYDIREAVERASLVT